MKIKIVCDGCGTDDCGRDAMARWDEEAQEWELSNVLDSGWCNECNSDRLKEIPL